jgi:hypothetical protein
MVNNTFQLIEERTDAVDQPPTWVGALRGLPFAAACRAAR